MMSEDTWNFDYPQIARDSGFKFRQCNDGHIDWRQIGGIEIEKIIQNKNIEKLDTIINHLAEVPLGSLLTSNILESGIVKYFILSQLAIQYLIFCKRFLDETVTTMRITLKEMQSEKIRFKNSEQEHANDILQLHKELQKLRNISEVIFPCSMCTKNFVSNEMLNIHISRKHSNEIKRAAAIQQNNVNNISSNSTEKRATEKENDKNLISTIKLELEIKHLKERLNDAEKIIRNQTFEITKQIEEIKLSPRSYQIQESSPSIKKENSANTVATKNEPVSTKTIGIQSNLVEEKETDDVDALDKKNILEIFKQINEKITKIENIRNDDIKNREETLTKFENKLQNVTESLEAKQQHNLEILNKFTDKMSSQTSLNQDGVNLEEIKEFLNNAVQKIQSENKKQLHEIAEKFDQTLLDKINVLKIQKPEKIEKPEEIVSNSSQDEIDRLIPNSIKSVNTITSEKDEALKQSKNINGHVPKIIERNDISRTPIFKNTQIPSIKRKQMMHSTAPKIIVKANRNEETSQSSGELSDSETSDTNSYSNNVEKAKKVMSSNFLVTPKQTDAKKLVIKDKITLKESSTPISYKKKKSFKETKKNIVPPLRLTQSSINIPKIVQKMQENRFKTIGISPNTKLIASSSMPQISENLSNIRKNKKKFFPKFNSTRNHIKTIVDNIIRTKNIVKSDKNYPQTASKQYSHHSKSETKQISSEDDMVAVNTNEIIDENNSESETGGSDITNRTTEDSEIKTPYSQAREDFKSKLERVLSSPIHKVKKIQSSDNLLLRTPVPTPRKKVMFDFPTKSTNENDFTLFKEDKYNKDY